MERLILINRAIVPTGIEVGYGSTPVVQTRGGQITLNAGAGEIILNGGSSIEADYLNIAFVDSIPTKYEFSEYLSSQMALYAWANSKFSEGTSLPVGEYLIASHKASIVRVSPTLTIELKPNTVIHLDNRLKGALEVHCLSERSPNSIRIKNCDHVISELSAGQRFAFESKVNSLETTAAVRKREFHSQGGFPYSISEFSFLSLYGNSKVLPWAWDRQGCLTTKKSVEKTQAALVLVTGGHGPFVR